MIFDINSGLVTFAIVIGSVAVIGVVAFVIYRLTHPKLKIDEEEQKTDKDYAKEELDRILQPVDDEETAQQISDYKDEDE